MSRMNFKEPIEIEIDEPPKPPIPLPSSELLDPLIWSLLSLSHVELVSILLPIQTSAAT